MLSFLESPCPGSGESQPMASVQHAPNAESRCSWGLGLLMDHRTVRDTHSHCRDSSLPSDHPQLKGTRRMLPREAGTHEPCRMIPGQGGFIGKELCFEGTHWKQDEKLRKDESFILA